MGRKKGQKKRNPSNGARKPQSYARRGSLRGPRRKARIEPKKILLNWVLPIGMGVVLAVALYIWMRGIPLSGIPKLGQVASVEITDTRLDPLPRVVTEPEELEKAVNIANFLKYRLSDAPEGEPFLTVTYRLKKGGEVTVAANEQTVFYRGKAHPVKEEGLFVKVAEGVFFFDLLAEPQG